MAILADVQAGRPTLIQKDGGEMLIAIVLDRPLAEAKALVDDPAAFTSGMTRVLRKKQSHPLLARMMKPAESSDPLQMPHSVAPVAVINPAPVSPCSFKLLELTWGTHCGHNVSLFKTVVLKFCHHGASMVDYYPLPLIP